MIIVFSGIDGSGKTTCAEFTGRLLEEKGLEHRYIHVVRDSFYNALLHDFIGRFSKRSKDSLETGLRNHDNKLYFSILKFIKKALLLINLLIFNLRLLRYRSGFAKNIICDRYFYDDIVQMKYLSLAGERFLSFFRRLIMKPDLIFFLKTNPYEAYKRKGEYDDSYYSKKCAIYEDFYKSVNDVIEVENASIEKNMTLVKALLEKALS